MSGNSPLLGEILGGANRDLQMLAARGLVPLPASELLAVQVRFAGGSDEGLALAATEAVRGVEARIIVDMISEGLAPEVLAFLARNHDGPSVLKAILASRGVEPDLLAELAEALDEELQELLLLRQDAIIEAPQILDALEKNSNLGSFARRRIQEYREHLLPRERAVRTKSRADLEAEADSVTDGELVEAINKARQQPAEGEEDDLTGLTEGQIRTLTVPQRMKLARGAARGLRGILVRDPNPMVATAVLNHNPVGESEIEQYAMNRAVIHEVLETIGNHRTWTRKYGVVAALVKNPRTPVGIAMRLLPRLAVRDLQVLSHDRNVSDAVRTGAMRLYKMKRA